MSNGNGNTADCEPATAAHDSARPETAKNHILSLAVVAQMFKIPPLALRLFELRGLIRRHAAGNTWVYSWSDCERIALLVKARKAGLAVRDLAAVLKAMDGRRPTRSPTRAGGSAWRSSTSSKAARNSSAMRWMSFTGSTGNCRNGSASRVRSIRARASIPSKFAPPRQTKKAGVAAGLFNNFNRRAYFALK